MHILFQEQARRTYQRNAKIQIQATGYVPFVAKGKWQAWLFVIRVNSGFTAVVLG